MEVALRIMPIHAHAPCVRLPPTRPRAHRLCHERGHGQPRVRATAGPAIELKGVTASRGKGAQERQILPSRTRAGSLPLARSQEPALFGANPNNTQLQVLFGVDLTVPRGTLHMLVGPNGCGKSTLLRMLSGMVPATGGTVHIDQPTSLVFQNPDSQVVMPTVGADVAFGLGCKGPEPVPVEEVRERVRRALALVRLDDCMTRPVHTLSGGQKQRVAIAGALADEPQVLLLDELTTFLDFGDQRGVLEAVRRVVDSGSDVTAIWVTHRLEELEFADGATAMEKGRVVFDGTGYACQQYIAKQKQAYQRR